MGKYKNTLFTNILTWIFCLTSFSVRVESGADNITEMSVAEAFQKHGIVPDTLPTGPTNSIKVHFDSGVEVSLGNELTPRQVKDRPTVSWDAKPGQLYTLVNTDPDSIYPEAQHWLVVNIPGDDIFSGDTLADYFGAGPPQGTGLHRYVFLVYQQPAGQRISAPPTVTREGRRYWSVRKFAETHGLGDPMAGNFYKAEYDDYVPEMHKLRSGN